MPVPKSVVSKILEQLHSRFRGRSNMISRLKGEVGGMTIVKRCEDLYIKSHKKCEDGGGGVKICQKGCDIIFERPLMLIAQAS